MEDPSMSTPHTITDTSTPTVSVPKDKSCPYCHQTFTSSSLGRHLDLFIRPRNPKAPDGIHNLEDIRQLRQGITRRQARTSAARRDVSTPASTAKQSANDNGSPMIAQTPSINGNPGDKVRTRLNEPIWQATGVINNLPPRPVSIVPDVRRDASRQQQLKAGLEQRQKLMEDLDNAKAAELALKEVLASVREASARVTGLALFDFDPYTLNFPSFCLRILPPPPTLFSPTPFPTSESWSINPPGQKQLEALNRLVQNRLATQSHQSPPQSVSTHSMSTFPPMLFEPEAQKLHNHFAEAFNHWKTLPEKQRYETWQLEILRLYTRAEESRSKAEKDLEAAKREIEQLNIQLEKANTSWMGLHQFPPPYSIHTPPPSLNLDPSTVKELSKKNVDMSSWDYDRLIEKWRVQVRAERQGAHGLNAQRSLSGSSQQSTIINGGTGNTQIPIAINAHVPTANSAFTHPPNPPTTTYPPFSTAPRTDSLDADPTDAIASSGGANSDDDADADADVDIDGAEDTPVTMPDALASPHVALPTQHHHQQQQQQHQQQQMSAWPRGNRHVNHARGFMPHTLPSSKMGGMEGPVEGFMGGRMGMGLGMRVGVRGEGG